MLTQTDWRCDKKHTHTERCDRTHPQGGRCGFFLWEEDEADAKRYHNVVETPSAESRNKNGDIRSFLVETPSPKLNRKRASEDVTDRKIDEDVDDEDRTGKYYSLQATTLSKIGASCRERVW